MFGGRILDLGLRWGNRLRLLLLCRKVFFDFVEFSEELGEIPEGYIAEFVAKQEDVIVGIECEVCHGERVNLFVHD